MTISAVGPSTEIRRARARARGFPVLTATLYESRNLIAAACGYILIIGLLVGLLLPAFKQLNIQVYLTGSIAALIGGSALSPNVPLFAVYMALELYGSFFMLLFGGVLAYAAGASLARNIEDGTVDIMLARPISRTRLYLEKWLAMLWPPRSSSPQQCSRRGCALSSSATPLSTGGGSCWRIWMSP